jgi:hypothetical protein
VADKLDESTPRWMSVFVDGPDSGGLTNTTNFGWPDSITGQSKSVITTLAPASSSGPNTAWITSEGGYVQTGPMTVDAANPVHGRATFEPEPGRAPFLATAENITNGPTPPCFVSELGLGLVSLSPPFLCRDVEPFGIAKRWFKVTIGLDANLNTPIHMQRLNLDSTVSPLQLTTTFPLPVGIFYTHYRADTMTYDPIVGLTAACPSAMDSNCMEDVADENGRWRSNWRLSTSFVAEAQRPYGRLLALMDFVMNPVTAGGVKAPLGR